VGVGGNVGDFSLPKKSHVPSSTWPEGREDAEAVKWRVVVVGRGGGGGAVATRGMWGGG
jgi:hypothetical protein